MAEGDVPPETMEFEGRERMGETTDTKGMEAVGDVLGRTLGMGDPADWPECPDCLGKFPALVAVADDLSLCHGCAMRKIERERLEADAERITSRWDQWLTAWLLRAGMSPREVEARTSEIPQRIVDVLPNAIVGAMTSGIVPRNGFGLRGEAGVGKTFAIAALTMDCAGQRIGAMVPTLGRRAFTPWLSWVRWPEHANRMRVLASRDGGMEEADEITGRLAEVDVLVIDDLGAERWKADDWVASMLDLVVDARYNARRATWYTTHLTVDGILDRYGQRLWSRLSGDNPLIEVGGRDLRIVR